MKNIHIIPTDKPSRLWLNSDNNLCLHTISTTLFKMQNIYITSDEEIKEGDWFINFNLLGKLDGIYSFAHKCINKSGQVITSYEHEVQDIFTILESYCKKIILTTDQDLIKDDIQAIPDEFLEWFVKNSSCEHIEVNLNFHMFSYKDSITNYKVIIPKEEPKQLVEEYEQQGLEKYSHELNQETLKDGTIIQFLNGSHSYEGVWFGDKHPYREGNFWWRNILNEWQAERIYNEEEVLNILWKLYTSPNYKVDFDTKEDLIEWFEKFKKE